MKTKHFQTRMVAVFRILLIAAIGVVSAALTGCSPSESPEAEPEITDAVVEKSTRCVWKNAPHFERGIPENYVLYYGGIKDESVYEELGRFDMIIIDPQSLGEKAAEYISGWQAMGRTVIGYLSCMEVAKWHRYATPEMMENALIVDGKPFNPFGENIGMDLTKETWQDTVVELVKSEVLAYGCDGMFMDTLADVDHPALQGEIHQAQLKGLDALLAKLRAAYPDLILISNWTIQDTLPVAANYVDVICWENFCADYFEDYPPDANASAFMKQTVASIKEQRAKHRFQVIALWAIPEGEENASERRERTFRKAVEEGYLPYACQTAYHSGFIPLDDLLVF